MNKFATTLLAVSLTFGGASAVFAADAMGKDCLLYTSDAADE